MKSGESVIEVIGDEIELGSWEWVWFKSFSCCVFDEFMSEGHVVCGGPGV